MSNISDSPVWEETVYQIDTTDLVLGGPDGASNAAAKDLANRTKYLKSRVEALETSLTNLPSGTLNHPALINRTAADAHPISAITGLQSALDAKPSLAQAAAAAPVQSIVSGANVSVTSNAGVYTIAATPGGNGTLDHAALSNRSLADQHPMSAITGLSDALGGKSASGHTHDAAHLVSGTLAAARLPSASTSAAGIVQLVDASDSDSLVLAPTAKALKTLAGLKANLASPDFSGTPTAPTAAAGTNTRQVATTAGVIAEILNQFHGTGKSLLANPGFQKFPNGTILQYGNGSLTLGQYQSETLGGQLYYTNYLWVAYPLAFPVIPRTAVATLACSLFSNQTPKAGVTATVNLSGTGDAKTGFVIAFSYPASYAGTSMPYHWFAVGY